MMGAEFVSLSLPPMLIGTLAAIACALPGNFLLLRRQALIGDAISHVVLPGIVAAFLLTGAVATWPMMLGAGGAALVAVLLIEAVRRLGGIEPGAAMGVVFTSMFAAGVLLLRRRLRLGRSSAVGARQLHKPARVLWRRGVRGLLAREYRRGLRGTPGGLLGGREE